MPTTMRRGHAFAIEGMGLFAAWTIILLLTWQRSAEWKNNTDIHTIVEKENELINLTNTLIQHHHINAWNGCAEFLSEKRRETPYILNEECLNQLKSGTNSTIQFIRIQTPTSEWIVYGQEEKSKTCIIIRRPFLLNGKIPSILEAGSCE